MKRSEMLKNVKAKLARTDFDFLHRETNLDYHAKVEILVEYLLGAFEQAGMLPPTINFDNREESYFNHNIWESEEE